MAHRDPSPFRQPSPYKPQTGVANHYSQFPTQLSTGYAQVGPGTITYTTSVGLDGRTVYQPYKAMAASYTSPGGATLNGIQWVPQEPTTAPPSNSTYVTAAPGNSSDPSMARYGTSYHGSSNSFRDDYKGTSDWNRTDDQRKKMEGKPDPEYDLLVAREKDAQLTAERNRRKSFSGGGPPPPPTSTAFPTPGGGNRTEYPTQSTLNYPHTTHSSYSTSPPNAPTYPQPGAFGHSRSASGSFQDATKQFGDMDLNRNKDSPEHTRKASAIGHGRSFSTSMADNTSGAYGRPHAVSGNYGDTNPYSSPSYSQPYVPSAGNYGNTKQQQQSNYMTPYPSFYPSTPPNVRSGDPGAYNSTISTGHPTAPGYPSSKDVLHSMAPYGPSPQQAYPRSDAEPPQPNYTNRPRSRAPSRAHSPNPAPVPHPGANSTYMDIGKSPHSRVTSLHGPPLQGGPSQQLPAPEAFHRPINGSMSFTPFDILKIDDMEEIYEPKLPKMPLVLATHDVFPEEWKRCMQDIYRAWTGQLPVAPGKDGQPPRRSTLTADLFDLWNASFFFSRGVELILYKGRERRTGPLAGQTDTQLPHYGYEESSSSSSTASSSDSDSDYYGHRVTDAYGRLIGQGGMSDYQEARRRRKERKEEKKRRRKEKRARRKARARAKRYSAYIACLPPRGPQPTSYPGRSVPPAAYTPNQQPVAHVGYSSPSQTYDIPTRSHGYGGGY